VLSLRRNSWLIGALVASVIALVSVFYVPALRDAFDAAPLSRTQWLAVVALSLTPVVIGEAVKASGLLARRHLLPP
jgi:hypothetical protein